jgi:hypothetical protein
MLFSKFEIDNNQLKEIVTVNYRTDNEGNNIRHTVIPYLSEKTYQSHLQLHQIIITSNRRKQDIEALCTKIHSSSHSKIDSKK